MKVDFLSTLKINKKYLLLLGDRHFAEAPFDSVQDCRSVFRNTAYLLGETRKVLVDRSIKSIVFDQKTPIQHSACLGYFLQSEYPEIIENDNWYVLELFKSTGLTLSTLENWLKRFFPNKYHALFILEWPFEAARIKHQVANASVYSRVKAFLAGINHLAEAKDKKRVAACARYLMRIMNEELHDSIGMHCSEFIALTTEERALGEVCQYTNKQSGSLLVPPDFYYYAQKQGLTMQSYTYDSASKVIQTQ